VAKPNYSYEKRQRELAKKKKKEEKVKEKAERKAGQAGGAGGAETDTGAAPREGDPGKPPEGSA